MSRPAGSPDTGSQTHRLARQRTRIVASACFVFVWNSSRFSLCLFDFFLHVSHSDQLRATRDQLPCENVLLGSSCERRVSWTWAAHFASICLPTSHESSQLYTSKSRCKFRTGTAVFPDLLFSNHLSSNVVWMGGAWESASGFGSVLQDVLKLLVHTHTLCSNSG